MGMGLPLKLPKFHNISLTMNFNSTAINSISDLNGDQVTIEFVSGKPYTYKVTDTEAWKNDLANVISEGESVGKFVNQALRVNLLELV